MVRTTDFISDISWQLLILFALCYFRGAVVSAMDTLAKRLSEIGKGGAKFGGPPLEQATSRPGAADPVRVTDDGQGLSNRHHQIVQYRPLLTRAETMIHSQLQTVTGDREPALVTALAQAQAALHLERANRVIWGSQLMLLQQLEQSSTHTTDLDEAKKLYEKGKSLFPGMYEQYPFDGWLAYLTAWSLVRVEGNVITLTEDGIAFLTYLRLNGYPMVRLG